MIYFKYLSILCFVFAMFFELAGFIWINRLYTACLNIQGVGHTLLKQILLRFTNCARLNIGICNTDSFVKKYISGYTFAGLHYSSPKKLGAAFSLTGVILTAYGTLSYSQTYYQYALISILFCMIYILFCHFVDVDGRLEQASNMITDYLDNTLKHRLVSFAAEEAAATKESSSVSKQTVKKETPKENSAKKQIVENSDEIIFSVINDFLV